MYRFFWVIFLLIVTESNSRCTKEMDSVQCDSTHDAISAHNQTDWNWTSLLAINFGDEHTIDAYFLQRIPKVTRLYLYNARINIEDNAFEYASSSLSGLDFYNCDLPVVKTKWFSNTSIRTLVIANCKLTTLEERCLDGLQRLSLNDNNISQIKENIFNGTSIVSLNLNTNPIRVIERNSFANMSKLSIFSVEETSLSSFNSKLIVGTKTPSLKYLSLKQNKIKYLDEDSFAMFPNIERLELDSNGIEFIGEDTFNNLNKLEHLELHNNKLKTISNRAFSYEGLPSLRTLHLHINQLNYLPRHFTRNFPKLLEISIFPNPWQCACSKEILHNLLVHHKNVEITCVKEYTNGLIPICVVPERNSGKCVENTQNYENFTQYYFERLREFDTPCTYIYY